MNINIDPTHPYRKEFEHMAMPLYKTLAFKVLLIVAVALSVVAVASAHTVRVKNLESYPIWFYMRYYISGEHMGDWGEEKLAAPGEIIQWDIPDGHVFHDFLGSSTDWDLASGTYDTLTYWALIAPPSGDLTGPFGDIGWGFKWLAGDSVYYADGEFPYGLPMVYYPKDWALAGFIAAWGVIIPVFLWFMVLRHYRRVGDASPDL